MPIFQLIYRSRAVNHLSEDQLVALLSNCRPYNKTHDITGLLLYGYGHFMQVLEGDQNKVMNLFEEKIALDTRHTDVIILQQAQVETSLFSQWNMGFHTLNKAILEELEGYKPAIEERNGKMVDLLTPLRLFDLMKVISLEMQSRTNGRNRKKALYGTLNIIP